MHLPTLRQLQFLCALADEKSFSRAADVCNVTQPTLSSAIKEVEAILGVQLVEREARGASLTRAGEAAVERARAILSSAADLVAAAHQAGEPLTGHFHLGAIPTLAPYLLPRIVPEVRRNYPDLKLYLREAKTDDLLHNLHAGEVDAVLLALPYEIGDLAVFPLFEDNYQLAIQPDHPLAKCARLSGEDLTGVQMMLLEKGHCLQRHALSAFAPLGPQQDLTFEATSLPTLVAMVAEGLGATLLPDIAIDAGDLLQTLTGMVWIDHRDDRSGTVAEHGQTGLAGEAGQSAVLEQHQPHLPKSPRRLNPAHYAAVPPAGRIPNPAIAEGRKRSSCNSRPTKGSSSKLRWLSRSGQRIRGNICAAAPFNNELSE